MKLTENSENDCSNGWGFPHSGHSKIWPLYPEANATYWFYAITRTEEDTTGLKFEGEFAHARFQSFTVYDDKRTPLAWISDVEITANENNENPYLPGVDRNTTNRKYTVAVVPEDTPVTGDCKVLTFPKNKTSISIWLRVYLPDQEVAHRKDGLSGGVPLPSIHAFTPPDLNNAAPCPQAGSINSNPPTGLPPNNSADKALFYRVPFGDLYPNMHNAYLTSYFDDVADKVAVVRFRAPTFADTFRRRSEQHDVIVEGNEVRYWSFNVGGAVYANTTACLADYDAKVTEDGYVFTVFGRESPKLKESADALGYNFLDWGAHNSPVVIYRNLLAAFAGGANNVPLYKDVKESADRKIGEYAPVGFIYASPEDFEANYDESIFDTIEYPANP